MKFECTRISVIPFYTFRTLVGGGGRVGLGGGFEEKRHWQFWVRGWARRVPQCWKLEGRKGRRGFYGSMARMVSQQ